VAVDGSAIPRRMAGAGVYTYQLVRALAALQGAFHLTVLARPGLFDDLPDVNVVHVRQRGRAARLAWEQAALPERLNRHRIEVLHSPHHHTPVFTLGVPRVVTVHDLTFLRLPERYPAARRLYMTWVTRAAARVAKAIITPSETVRADVIERLGVPPERVVAIPEAAGPQYQRVDDDALGRMRWKYHLPSDYILSVGSLEPGKNRPRLIRASARLRDEGVDVPLVIAGQRAWRYEGEAELVRELGLREHVRFLGYVPDEDMPSLYAGATLLAFPSLYEGFGLPVLEAMACGTPVVTSNVSATAEAAGDAARLVDPTDLDALTDALRVVLSDPSVRFELQARGLERAAQFSWERAARETLAVYEAVAEGAEARARPA
jgi:glycosyltransferase involved in cell wall biosynthesis